jgi:hypothetical protein
MPSVPAPLTVTYPSFGALNVGDTINYKGQQYTITNVTGPVDDGLGTFSYTVTIVVGGSNVVINCNASNTTINSPGTEASTGHESWSHSGPKF